jgi:hypothetical protein
MAKAKMKQAPAFELGKILGHIDLSKEALEHARDFALEHFESQKELEFCGNPVDLCGCPAWAIESDDWIPADQLKAMGLVLNHDRKHEGLVATVGVDQHVDATYGLAFCLVLHSDGFKFRQGRESITPVAGDWFIFNDYINHGVKESADTTAFVAIVLPLLDALGEKTQGTPQP